MILRRTLLCAATVITTCLPTVALAATRPAASSAVPVTVSVQSGQTLWGLSSTYHVPVHQLESWNHLTDNSTLQIGQKIIIGWTSSVHTATPLSGRDGSFASFGEGVRGEQVVAYARQFLGVPYSWGGESTNGFDCSGFVSFTLGHFGVSLDHSSFSQYNAGTYVSESDLMPGDLVFFSSNGSGPSHVGIYIGGSQFINAEERGVAIDSLASGYWASCYYGARRVL